VFILCWFAFADALHTGYHLSGYYLEDYRWFQILREIHFGHHQGNMLKNFGAVDFTMDTLMGNLALC
jgi:hypothetical protein